MALPLPDLGLGTLHMAPADEIPERKEPLLPIPCGGLPQAPPTPSANTPALSDGREHCSGVPRLKVDGPSLTSHRAGRTARALPNWGPNRAAMAGTLRASESWHQVKLRHSAGTGRRDRARLSGQEAAALNKSAF